MTEERTSSKTPEHTLSNNEDEKECCIQDVWDHNLEEEFNKIRKIIKDYPYIAMDTEFPGVVFSPPDNNSDKRSFYSYRLIKCNVDLLKIIQIGFTFADENGNLAKPISTWQFNFKFDLDLDYYSQASIDLLIKSGIKFKEHKDKGIDSLLFGELLTSSGLVLMDEVKWLTFHSAYDFGYLLKLLTCSPLPEEVEDFYQLLHVFFSELYDIKHLMQTSNQFRGGLQELADQLKIKRVGPQHQAGSDSMLTGAIFFKMKKLHLENTSEQLKGQGFLYGIDVDN